MCNRIKNAKQIRCAKTVFWDLINSNMNKRDVQEGCANGLYRVCTHSSNVDDENINVLQLIMSLFVSLALNGGGHIFHSPSSPLFSLLSCIVSSIERHSLHCSPNWKIMDLINWSLNAIDTIFLTRSLGSGEPVCPDGTLQLHDGCVGEVTDSVSSGSSSVSQFLPSCSWSACQMAVNRKDGYLSELSLWGF